jgi:hypothetical protein
MLRFKDFAPAQIYRSGPHVVSESEIADFCEMLGQTVDILADAELSMFDHCLTSTLSMRMLVLGELKVCWRAH